MATDARLLFYDPAWSGFDVVVGNPPYEGIVKGKPARERNAIRRQLSGRKQYTTVDGGDLYNLFCEIALTLVKQRDGVVTLIVPLSLAFGQDKHTTRRLFENRAKSIRLRHQDIRPDKTFHDSPVAHPENSQRTTIVTAATGKSRAVIETTGTGKWLKSDRELYLLNRQYAVMPRRNQKLHESLINQWPRVPTEAVSRLVSEMMTQRRTVQSLAAAGENVEAIAFPKSCRYYITGAPAGLLERGETALPIVDTASLELAMAAVNGHVAYAWWRVWGDAFHVNAYELTSVTIPDAWLDDADMNQRARSLGRQLIASITPDNVKTQRSGTGGNEFENINFYEVRPDTIRQLDELHLEALGLRPMEPLLGQLRKMRSNSNWRLA